MSGQEPNDEESIWRHLGIPEPRSLPNCGRVDIELLRKYLGDESDLTPTDQKFVFCCLMDFRDWRDAAIRILSETRD